ncbi:MAG: aminoacyl-tRNA hydrolase [Armatimonadota bacterium]|nr:aminoacyl-tRNA hydrolase [bacterium]MDW8321739.1 aminoacyl-tRNA hydrolase [Armatimonadota bacterium]
MRRKTELPPEWIVLGLGNPGAEYAHTRHNIGFEVVHILANRHRIRLSLHRDHAQYGFGTVADVPVLLAKPMTYMNRSGEAARALLQRYPLEPSRLLVVVDDIALPLGRIRVRSSGSDGGHNGLASIIQCVGTQTFPRVRVGIGSPPPGQMVEYVLSRFLPQEQPVVEETLQRAADAVEVAIAEGVQEAMNRFNAQNPFANPAN